MSSVFDDSYRGIPGNHQGKTFDILLELIPTGTVQASGTASAVVDFGTGLIDQDLVFDVSAIDGAATVAVQLSATEDFSSPIVYITANLTEVGRTVVPFRNAAGNEEPKPYIRLMPTIGTSLTMGAFIGNQK